MAESWRRWIGALGLALCVSLSVCSQATFAQPRKAKPTAPPLTREQVADMVSSGVGSVDILVEAKLRGLAFIVGPTEIEDLTKRGGDSLLLNWLGLYSVELQPKFSTALSELKRKRFTRVIELCDEVLKQSPHVLHVYLIRGGAFRAERRFDQAAEDFRQAIELHRNSSRARVLLAETLIAQNKTDQAITELNWVVEHRSAASILDWPLAHRLLAAAYMQRKEYRLASQELHTVLWQLPASTTEPVSLLPDLEDHMSALCRLLALCPDPAVASPMDAIELSTLMKLMAQNPEQQETALLRLAEGQAAAGQFDEAAATARSAEILGIGSDKNAIRERIELYRKKQLPLLPPGATSVASTKPAKGEIASVDHLLANMVQIDPIPAKSGNQQLQPFLIGKYEVTRAEWAAIMGTEDVAASDLPIEQISWDDAQEFLKKLNAQTGSSGPHFRLPKVAEWRSAVQSNSRKLSRQAWYADHGNGTPHKVGTLAANSQGVFDLYGNVAEWCEDLVDRRRGGTPQKVAFRRVMGGGYLSSREQCTSTTGSTVRQNVGRRGLGLRLAADVVKGRAASTTASAETEKRPGNKQGLTRAIESVRGALERETFQRAWLQERLFHMLYLQASVRSHLEDRETAATNLRTVIRESPQDSTPLIQLSRCHLAWIQATRPSPTPDQLTESRQVVEAALSRGEFRLWIAFLAQAALFQAEGKPDDAVRRLNQALDLAPSEFKSMCTVQLEAIRQKKRLPREFPISPAFDAATLFEP